MKNWDLKSVNPNKAKEILDTIEEKGIEMQKALELLRDFPCQARFG